MRLREYLTIGEVEEIGGDLDQNAAGLTYDSRRVERGHVFFAIPGERSDGHDFIGEAVRRGAAGIVVARKASWPSGTTWIRVKDVRRAMGLWGDYFFGRPSSRMTVVGVTGTNGKTTVTYLVESMLRAAGMEPGVIGTINYRYRERSLPAHQTTPESLDLQALLAEMAGAGVRSVAMEVSSHALAMERVCGIDFDVALFTNLSRDHLDFHADMDDYFFAKSRLFTDYLKSSSKAKKSAVIHGGDARGRELLERVRAIGLECWSYGRGADWDIRPDSIHDDLAGLRGKIRVKDATLEFSSRLIGAANLENILGAVGVGFALGLPPPSVAAGIARLEAVPGRLEKVDNDLGVSILVDYAHTPDALERVLETLRPLTRGRVVTVFGCGGDRDRGKRPLMGEIAARWSDIVVLTSDNPRTEEPIAILGEIERGVAKTGMEKFEPAKSELPNFGRGRERGYFVEPDRRAAIRLALRLAQADDLVLIAGKGHEDYQILGTKKIHFDDREVARAEIGRRAGA